MAHKGFNALAWIDAIWASEHTLTTSERAVLTVLVRHASASGECFPGLGTIASKSNLTRRTVITNIKTLKAHGLFRCSKRSRGNGFQANLYHLSSLPPEFPLPVPDTPQSSETISLGGGDLSSLVKELPGATISPPVVKPFHSGGDLIAHEVTHEVTQLKDPLRTSAIEVPKSKSKKASKATKSKTKKPPHPHSSELKEFYFAEMLKHRDIKATFAARQWSRAMASFGELFDTLGDLVAAKAVITNALSNSYAQRIQPWDLVADINKHRKPPNQGGTRKAVAQRGLAENAKIAIADENTDFGTVAAQ